MWKYELKCGMQKNKKYSKWGKETGERDDGEVFNVSQQSV